MTTAPEEIGLPDRVGTLADERQEQASDYQYDEGDRERFAHYVPKDAILESAMTGKPVRALCGKLWVPSRDPERFPICPMCKEIYESLPKD
jgi:hypothetical protein